MNKVASWATRVVLSVASVAAAFGMMCAAGGGAPQAFASEPSAYAQPGPGDFKVWNDTIQGLKDSYVASLTEEQKQDVRLVIPDEINGQKITTIGNSAFYSYTNPDLVFTQLDFSRVTALASIGSNAFRYASKLTGDLVLPDTITELGESAFADCGFSGTLHLPANSSFTTVPGQAFLNTPFTGALDIPSNVEIIQRKAFENTLFSGKLDMPEGVTELYASAFAGCARLTAVVVPSTMDFKKRETDSGHHFRGCSSLTQVEFAANSSVTTLFSEVFGGCSSLRVISLPDSITSIDGAAFRSSGLRTVYMPASATFASNASSFLTTADNAVAVCRDKASYDAYRAQLPSGNLKYLGYPATIAFDAGSEGANPPSIERLVNQPFNRVKDEASGVWAVDGSYALPSLGGETQKTPWYYDMAKTKPIEVTTTISEAMLTLYAGPLALSDPTLVPTEVFVPYDGKEHYLKIAASHPLVKDPREAEEGDYSFYYLWRYYDSPNKKWITIKQGFYDDSHALKNVADTGYYGVYVYFARLQSGKWKVLTTETKGYKQITGVISAVSPDVDPLLSPDAESNLPGFPGLALGDGDTPGTITWKAGQTLADGVNAYTWTFKPESPAPGKLSNYTSATGSIELRVVDGKVMHNVVFDSAGGTSFDDVDVAFGATLPAAYVPVKDGFVFVGWYRDAELAKPFSMADRVSQDMTLHARWEKRVAVMDPGDGELEVNGEPIDQQAKVVDVVHVPEVASEQQDALQTSDLVAGKGEPAGFFELNLTVDGEIVERAEFKCALPVTVAFPVEERTHYTVAHLRHDGSVEVLDTQADVAAQTLSFSVDSLSPFMVTALKLCDVAFDSAGGTAVAPVRDVAAGSRLDAPPTPTRDGYAFVGWSRDVAGAQPWAFDRDTVKEDLTLYAQWKKNDAPEPDVPVVPDPDDPDVPTGPVGPDVPDDPTGPDGPETPDPEDPGDPEDPDVPGEVGDPEVSTDPPAAEPPASDAEPDAESAPKPLPAAASLLLPKSGDAPLAFAIASLALVATLSGCLALRHRRRS